MEMGFSLAMKVFVWRKDITPHILTSAVDINV
jgi:hypothetical protein